MDKPEWIILMLAANNNEPIKGITRFEKLLFYTLSKYFKADLPAFGYEAYNFGPHSDEIRDIIYALADADLINVNQENAKSFLEISDVEIEEELQPIDYEKMEEYVLTDDGVEISKKIRENYLKEKIKNSKEKKKHQVNEHLIDNIKQSLNNISLKDLIKLVYTEFPEMTEKSIIKDEILG